jgi:uncharacterized protein
VRSLHEGMPVVRDEPGVNESGHMSIDSPEPFLRRTYRESFRSPDLTFFHVAVEQTDLFIGIGRHAVKGCMEAVPSTGSGAPVGRLTSRILKEAEKSAEAAVYACRDQLESQIRLQPGFLTSLIPLDLPAACPSLIADMVRSARLADVGPMAAVAGAVAEHVGKILAERFSEVIVENGGDIWMTGTRDRMAGLFCGHSPLNGKLGLRLPAEGFPLGLCTSSGTVGHSLSFGRADAATVKAKSASLADAVATGFGNRVKTAEEIPDALEWASSIPGVLGLLVVIGDRMGAWGDMELVALHG